MGLRDIIIQYTQYHNTVLYFTESAVSMSINDCMGTGLNCYCYWCLTSLNIAEMIRELQTIAALIHWHADTL